MNKQEMLLTQLSEECAEISQMCSKINRFGLNEKWSKADKDNQGRLIGEIVDFVGVVRALQLEGVLPGEFLSDLATDELINKKVDKVNKYLEYSKQQGTLTN